jgi:hypothetical protein
METTMKNKKDNLLGALYILRNVMLNYDTKIAHNILVNFESEQTEEEMDEDLCNYIDVLDELIKETWLMEGSPELISNTGEKLSK